MRRIAVIGLGFGDEGKGMVTSSLAECHKRTKNPLIVRFSGGHQAGHTVHYGGHSHVFSNFGSGALQDIPTYWSKACTVDPVGLSNELKVLIDKVDPYNIQLFINNDCPVTTPYDITYNRSAGRARNDGTCGVGFGATLEREENNMHFRFSDLFYPTIMNIKLTLIADDYGMAELPLDEFREAVKAITNPMFYPSEIITPVENMPSDYYTYIFEGSQGLLLDKDIGFFPHVTRSNVGLADLAHKFEPIDEVYYITRAYQTRHGNGPMTSEHDQNLKNTESESNKTHPYQGEFRTGVLDLDLLKYAIERDRRAAEANRIYAWLSGGRKENLVITCMDQMTRFRLIKASKIHTYDNANEFVREIISTLGIRDNTYTSWSPESEINIVIK